MNIDSTAKHSWEMVKRHYHAFRGDNGFQYGSIRAVVEYVCNHRLDDVLFGRTSHDMLIISPYREYYKQERSLRISQIDQMVTCEAFDSKSNDYQTCGQCTATEVEGMLEGCLTRIMQG